VQSTQADTEKATEKASTDTKKDNTEQSTGKSTGKSKDTENCNHDWQFYDKKYNPVEEKGHYEEVMVQDEYEEPVKERHSFCNGCGLDCTDAGVDASSHAGHCPSTSIIDLGNGDTRHSGASWSVKSVIVDYIHHDAEYETEWVVDVEAHDEVTEIMKCSKCGKTKDGQTYNEYYR
jgi:hypothetical protein